MSHLGAPTSGASTSKMSSGLTFGGASPNSANRRSASCSQCLFSLAAIDSNTAPASSVVRVPSCSAKRVYRLDASISISAARSRASISVSLAKSTFVDMCSPIPVKREPPPGREPVQILAHRRPRFQTLAALLDRAAARRGRSAAAAGRGRTPSQATPPVPSSHWSTGSLRSVEASHRQCCRKCRWPRKDAADSAYCITPADITQTEASRSIAHDRHNTCERYRSGHGNVWKPSLTAHG